MTAPDDQITDLLRRCFQRPEAEWAQAVETLCGLYPEHAALLRRQFETSRPPRDPAPADPSLEMFGLSISPEEAAEEEALPESTETLQFVRQLGRGGMGVVYEARDLASGRHVAVKVVSDQLAFSESAAERFDREARTAARISHPSCVFVYGAHRVHGTPAISMELMSGETLDDLVKREGPASIDNAVAWTKEVLDGLEAAHDAGIIHRDIKPANLFLTDEGRVKVGDFGLSRPVDTDLHLTMTGAFLGSPMYASPEQVRGKSIDERTDLYSVGATLYALVTGRAPHSATSIGDLFAQIATEAPKTPRALRPDLPRELEKVILRSLDKDPAKRFPTCAEFRAALEPFQKGALSPAGLGLRVGAYGFDLFVASAIAQATGLAGVFVISEHVTPVVAAAWKLLVYVLYFGLSEGLRGTTLGKRLLGLRVAGPDGGRPGVGRATLRALIFNADAWFQPFTLAWTNVATLILTFLPFVSTRRRNGFRGLHELATGTRVLQTTPGIKKLRRARRLDPPRETRDERGSVDRFTLRGRIWENPSGTLDLAHDPRLDRSVWVHRAPTSDGPADEDRTGRSPASLRWLEGGTEHGSAWNVYEAPGGASIAEYAASDFRLDWITARGCLLSLATLLETGHASLTLTQLWIDRNGHLRVLDFAEDARSEATAGLALLAEVARILLGVRAAAPGQADLSAGARASLDRVFNAPDRFQTVAEAREAIEALELVPRPVPRSSRLLQLGLGGLHHTLVIVVATALNLEQGRVSGIPQGFVDVLRTEPWAHVAGGAFLVFVLLPSLALSVVLRGGLLFWILGIGILDQTGHRAGRLRCVVRSLIALSPLWVGFALLAVLGHGLGDAFTDWVIIAALAGVAASTIAALVWPRRTFADRLAGTTLAME